MSPHVLLQQAIFSLCSSHRCHRSRWRANALPAQPKEPDVPVTLRAIAIPDFGLPVEPPTIPPTTYAAHCRRAYDATGCTWLVVYADREHAANILYLTGFEPRFEEALLLLGPRDRRFLVVGNEGEGYAPVAALPDLSVVLAQSLSLMAQDRTQRPDLQALLRECGLTAGDSIGLVGWKYAEPTEFTGIAPRFFAPAWLVAVLAAIAGEFAEATPVLMHPVTGLRAVVDADQIAAYEWGAARASAALWRILAGVREGERELEAAARMGFAGEPMTCHAMLTSGSVAAPVVGMRSPGGRRLQRGDGITAAIGYWGGLSSRGGLLAEADDDFLKLASGYFAGLLAWYEAVTLGASGGDIHESVAEALAKVGLRSALNPGHLTGHDEWVHSPIRPGSADKIASGMPFQVDIIPVPMPPGRTLNCEDGAATADAALRSELQRRHPEVSARIAARQRFIREEIGFAMPEHILPLSSTPLCLAPFWLAPRKLLVAA
jgi:Xaa-Pro aminopeptidase